LGEFFEIESLVGADGVLEALESDLLSMSTLKRLVAEASEGANNVHRALLRRFEECTAGKVADDMTLMALESTPEPRRVTSWILPKRVEQCASLC